MPNRLPHRCNKPGCSALTADRYCKTHSKEREKRRGSAASRGYDRSWQKLRLVVLQEEPLCRHCLKKGVVTPATDVDHIDGNVENTSRENLCPLCHECHARKTVLENYGFGRAPVIKRIEEDTK